MRFIVLAGALCALATPAAAQFGCTRYYDQVYRQADRFACERAMGSDPDGAHVDNLRRRQNEVEAIYRQLQNQQR